jgi:hypothetical protein
VKGRAVLAKWTAAVLGAMVIVTVVVPGQRALTLVAGTMVLLAIALVALSMLAHHLARPSPAWERVRAVHHEKTERPADLERIERRLGWGRYSAGDFNYRVRPTLRRLAAHRLREHHHVDSDDRPDAATELVSAELWSLVIAKEPPDSEHVLGTGDIARLVDEIERI